MPYTVSICSNAGSTAANFLRMRFTCEVIVPSSTTRFASRMRPSRSFTWPGNFASVCTIQNSVSVSSTGLPFHDAAQREAPVGLLAQADVDHGEIGEPRLERAHRLAARRVRAHLVAVLPERVSVVGADCGVVFDDGDAAGHGRLGLSPPLSRRGAAGGGGVVIG